MAGPTHVYRRGAAYWWRRRVPKALIAKFGCPELRFSLRTHIRRDAAHRAARLRLVTDLAFGAMEQAVLDGARLTPEGMKAVVDGLVRAELDAAERARALAPPRGPEGVAAAVSEETRRQAALRDALAQNRYDSVMAPVEAALRRAGLAFDPHSDDGRILLRLAGRALVGVHGVNALREQGIYEEDACAPPPAAEAARARAAQPVAPAAPVPIGSSAAASAASASPAAAGAIPIGEAARLLIEEKSKSQSWRLNMRRKYDASLRLFIEANGDLPLCRVTTAMGHEFRELLMRLPRNHGKSARDRRAVHEIAEALDEEEMDKVEAHELQFNAGEIDRKTLELRKDQCRIARLGPTTVNLHVDRIKAVFDEAIGKELFAGRNPMIGVRLGKREQKNLRKSLPPATRLPWGRERIQRLFGSSVFVGGLPDGHPCAADPLFWAPLAAAHMGLREEEILQTQVHDVEPVDAVPCWRIRPGPGKTLKTDNAERDVPLQRVLIEAGFLELVEALKREGAFWLFPEIDRGAASNRFSDLFSKRFRTYRVNEGLYDRQRDFHALRKDFNVALREAGVYWAARRRLLGHALDDVTDERYDPEGESMKVRKEYVDRVDHGLKAVRRDGKVVIVVA